MLHIQENIELKGYTTFRIGGKARFFVSIQTTEELEQALTFAYNRELPIFILGGGSNILISDQGFDGLVISVNTKGYEVVREDENSITLRVGSAQVWDDFVFYVVSKGYWGVENLSHIPGKCGAFAVQNVGAYGQEASQVVMQVHAYDTKERLLVTLSNKGCSFTYRKSIFNHDQKGRYIILYTDITLSKHPKPMITYPDVIKYFEESGTEPTLENIRKAIITIRDNKLPSIHEIGNAGSFFKNQLLTKEQFSNVSETIQKHFDENVLSRLQEITKKFAQEKTIKIPSAFLIDICGLKGAQMGHARVHEKQPLVIVNVDDKAIAQDVLTLMSHIRNTVFAKTGCILEPEPQFIGFTQAQLDAALSLT